MFTTTNQNQNDNMSYYNGLKPMWVNQPLKEEDEENGQDVSYGLNNNDAWKVIGNTPRRMSISGLQQQMIDDKVGSKNLLTVDDFNEIKKRNRAASTPVPPMGLNNDLLAYQLSVTPLSPTSVDSKTEESNADAYYALRQAQQRQQQQWNAYYQVSANNAKANSITEEEHGELSEKSGSYTANNGSHPSTPVALPTPPMVTITTTDVSAAPAITTTMNISSLPSTPESQPAQPVSTTEGSENGKANDTEGSAKDEKEALAVTKPKPAVGKIRINTNFNFDGKLEHPDNNEMQGRQYRSSSISVGTFNTLPQLQPTIHEEDEDQMNNYLKPKNLEMSNLDMNRNIAQQNSYLSSLNYDMPKSSRSRSKSSSEIYGKFSEQNLVNLINNGYDLNGLNYTNNLSGMNSPLWRNNNYNLLQALMAAQQRNGPASASLVNSMSQMSSFMGNDLTNLHRRSSTQPTYNNLWGTSGPINGTIDANVSNPTSPLSPTMPTASSVITSPLLSPNHLNSGGLLSPQLNYFQNTTVGSNYSLASPTNSQNFRFGINDENLKNEENMRRNSVTGSLYNSIINANGSGMTANNMNGGESNSNDGAKQALSNQGSDYVNEIDDYFENTEHRTRAWVEAGKNLQNQQQSQHWPLYIVEFKAGRTDYFYISEKSGLIIKNNDLVIVEADRGKDLGKVVASNITNYQQIQAYQAQHADDGMELQKDMQIHPKRIYRLAQKAEIDMLIAKCQDEIKAKSLCQTKVRQKKLPMEIVDAEFQWDRKKLTFYFVSDRRIDFRELVRELFKIYKTRIWMCAVSSIPN
ncbi:PSP1-domain-containing protein [Neocallimastix californiae]|uniref:PSP1-domain-containing protein n=1 Tax=Neocallimastix californiae TaxID=1754190 RepID=A0A1Y2EGM7_9FUNG|nr:PSP1-domain-containing protein [Neocallimastix californiae]|eukprot:ORY70729.1 PSP1-domain-containing protein [Neocallimastix californiae]